LHVAQLRAGPTVKSFAIKDCRVLKLSDDTALFAYRSDFTRTGRDAAEGMYVSSIWRKHASGWVNVFSQDTPAVG